MTRKQQLGALILALCAGILFGLIYHEAGWKAIIIIGSVFVFASIIVLGIWLLVDNKP